MKKTLTGYYGYDPLDGSDDRCEEWEKERNTLGYDSSEIWSLGDTIVKFSLPRIKRMKLQDKDFEKKYDTLIEGLELFIRSDGNRIFSKTEEKKVNKSLKLFGKMLPNMWC